MTGFNENRASRVSTGRPDVSGVWHVEPTLLEEMKHLFANNVYNVNLPGTEADTISRYARKILVDFKPEEAPLRTARNVVIQASRFPRSRHR